MADDNTPKNLTRGAMFSELKRRNLYVHGRKYTDKQLAEMLKQPVPKTDDEDEEKPGDDR